MCTCGQEARRGGAGRQGQVVSMHGSGSDRMMMHTHAPWMQRGRCRMPPKARGICVRCRGCRDNVCHALLAGRHQHRYALMLDSAHAGRVRDHRHGSAIAQHSGQARSNNIHARAPPGDSAAAGAPHSNTPGGYSMGWGGGGVQLARRRGHTAGAPTTAAAVGWGGATGTRGGDTRVCATTAAAGGYRTGCVWVGVGATAWVRLPGHLAAPCVAP